MVPARHGRYIAAAPLSTAAILAAALAARPADAQVNDCKDSQGKLIPCLRVNIPTVHFTPPPEGTPEGLTERIEVPFLAQYISGVYQYAVYAAMVVAGAMAVIGGFQWLTGGDSKRVGEGKERITNAVIGMVLVLGAYVIMHTINPDMISLKALGVSVVAKQEEVNDSEVPGMPEAEVDAAGDSAAFDPTFKKYASCAGVDWRILKAVAKKESGFNPAAKNSIGFIGLFQTKPNFCKRQMLAHNRANECTEEGLTDPDTNTASTAYGQLKSGANLIKQRCPDLRDPERFVMLLYFSHNSGVGSLKSVLDVAGCNSTNEQYFEASKNYWEQRAIRKNIEVPNAAGRMQYALKVAKQAVAYGVTDPLDLSGNDPCPTD